MRGRGQEVRCNNATLFFYQHLFWNITIYHYTFRCKFFLQKCCLCKRNNKNQVYSFLLPTFILKYHYCIVCHSFIQDEMTESLLCRELEKFDFWFHLMPSWHRLLEQNWYFIKPKLIHWQATTRPLQYSWCKTVYLKL